MIVMLVTLTLSAIFTGAAFYINFAEQPARLRLAPAALVTEWVPSYHRGLIMQSSIAIAAGVLGVVSFVRSSNSLWLIGAIAIVANWPFTMVVMLPVNSRIKATLPANADSSVVQLVRHWGRLHAVRTVLGAISTTLFLLAVLGSH